METRASMIIQSHLSDALIEMTPKGWDPMQVQERLRFVKYLIHMFPDTNQKIDADVVYEQFKLGDK
jgi:hypothetical protein